MKMNSHWGYWAVFVMIYAAIVSCSNNTGLSDQAPEITEFSVSADTITKGESASLSVVFTNGTGIIDNGIGEVSSGDLIEVTPGSDTTYTLTVTGESRKTLRAKLVVNIIPRPQIISFESTVSFISKGDEIGLIPIFNGGEGAINKDIGAVTSGEELRVSPNSNTTFTLVVTNEIGYTTEMSVSIFVSELPSITTFESSRNTITQGEKVTLTGVFANGVGVIDQNVGNIVSKNSINVYPTSTTSYKLTVTNAAGLSVNKLLTVNVIPAPVIKNFIFSRDSITLGESTNLTAVFEYGAGHIDNAIGEVVSGSSYILSPSVTTTYILTIENELGYQVSQGITLDVYPEPIIEDILVSASTIAESETVTLTPVFIGGSGKIDNGIGSVFSNAEIIATPSETTTYTLTVSNKAGRQVSSSVVIRVIGGDFKLMSSTNLDYIARTATLLQNGLVLVVGGESSVNNSELFDPSIGFFGIAAPLKIPRTYHTATLLKNGKVLIVGGRDMENNYVLIAELYDPITGQFSKTGSLSTGSVWHTATLLHNGNVLITGGTNSASGLKRSEIYNTKNGLFEPTGDLPFPQFYHHRATLLNDGNVLFTGLMHDANAALLYNLSNGSFIKTGDLNEIRLEHTATLLNDGTVLITSGNDKSNKAEIYNPATGEFAYTGAINFSRYDHVATKLLDGNVLITGGRFEFGADIMAGEIYDVDSEQFYQIGSLNDPRGFYRSATTVLKDGSVLIIGGGLDNTSVELYTP